MCSSLASLGSAITSSLCSAAGWQTNRSGVCLKSQQSPGWHGKTANPAAVLCLRVCALLTACAFPVLQRSRSPTQLNQLPGLASLVDHDCHGLRRSLNAPWAPPSSDLGDQKRGQVAAQVGMNLAWALLQCLSSVFQCVQVTPWKHGPRRPQRACNNKLEPVPALLREPMPRTQACTARRAAVFVPLLCPLLAGP